MIRLTLILAIGLFVAMKFGGEDRGQTRFGLMPSVEVTPAETASQTADAPANVVDVAFVPAAPVMTTPVIVATASVSDAAAAPVDSLGRILTVNTKSVNVRSGPGTEFDVVERLVRGDSVLVVANADAPAGWSMIRIEGDGVEGYVASRLLSE